jgi:hypothetical protein
LGSRRFTVTAQEKPVKAALRGAIDWQRGKPAVALSATNSLLYRARTITAGWPSQSCW